MKLRLGFATISNRSLCASARVRVEGLESMKLAERVSARGSAPVARRTALGELVARLAQREEGDAI